MLKGQAKTNYQREYMRRLRLRGKHPLGSSTAGKVLDLPRWCIVCGESRVVESHHIDRSHDNQSPTNLVDLCPTCHRVLHRQGLTVEELMPVRPTDKDILIARDYLDNADVPDDLGVSYIDADGNPVYTG